MDLRWKSCRRIRSRLGSNSAEWDKATLSAGKEKVKITSGCTVFVRKQEVPLTLTPQNLPLFRIWTLNKGRYRTTGSLNLIGMAQNNAFRLYLGPTEGKIIFFRETPDGTDMIHTIASSRSLDLVGHGRVLHDSKQLEFLSPTDSSTCEDFVRRIATDDTEIWRYYREFSVIFGEQDRGMLAQWHQAVN